MAAPAAGGAANGTNTDTLVLPKFKKQARKIDYSLHDWCCEASPPGEQDTEGKNSPFKSNNVNLWAIAASNVGGRDHMEDRHR